MRPRLLWLAPALHLCLLPAQGQPVSEKRARETIAAMRVNGRVGGSFDLRVTATDRSYNYKLRATWLTPQVFEAAGAVLESAKGMAAGDAQRLLQEFTSEPAHYVLVELDPREGSGVIPRDWLSRFGPKGVPERQVVGQVVAQEGGWRALMGAFPRDYAYDVFIVRFPVTTSDGTSVLQPADKEAQLMVRIYSKGGAVDWRVPTASPGP